MLLGRFFLLVVGLVLEVFFLLVGCAVGRVFAACGGLCCWKCFAYLWWLVLLGGFLVLVAGLLFTDSCLHSDLSDYWMDYDWMD